MNNLFGKAFEDVKYYYISISAHLFHCRAFHPSSFSTTVYIVLVVVLFVLSIILADQAFWNQINNINFKTQQLRHI